AEPAHFRWKQEGKRPAPCTASMPGCESGLKENSLLDWPKLMKSKAWHSTRDPLLALRAPALQLPLVLACDHLFADFGDVVLEQCELFEEVMLLDAHGTFEEASQVTENAGFSSSLGQ